MSAEEFDIKAILEELETLPKTKPSWPDPRRGRRSGDRRPHGLGSIRWIKTKALFEVRVSLKVDGKRKQVSRYFKTERDAWEGLQALHGERTLYEKNRKGLKLESFLDAWLGEMKDSTAAATYRLYETTVRTYIKPELGWIDLEEIDAARIDGFMSHLRATGASASRRKSVLAMLSRILNAAVRKDYIAKNPATAAAKPRVPKARTQILTEVEAKRLLEVAKSSAKYRPHYALFVLALGTAMREGELFALHWNDVDLKQRRVTVRYSLAENLAGKLERKSTKTGGTRILDISTGATEALKAHVETLKRGGYAGPWLFPNTEGGPLRKSNFLRRVFHPLLEDARLPKVRFHSLRHFSNSLLASKGVPITVLQVRGGWASSRMPLDVYGALLEGQQREAADMLDDLV